MECDKPPKGELVIPQYLGENMKIKHLIGAISGAVCLALGIYLLVSSKGSMDTAGEKIRKELSGEYSSSIKNQTMLGIGLAIVGAGVLFYSLRTKAN